MSVAPIDANCVRAHFLALQDLKHWVIHRERVFGGNGIIGFLRLRSVRARTARAGAFITQVTKGVFASMAILPVDLDSLGFRNSDMFGLRCAHFLLTIYR